MFEDILGSNDNQACKARPADPYVNHLRLQSTHITSGMATLPDFKKQHYIISKLLDQGIDVKIIKYPNVTTTDGLTIIVTRVHYTYFDFKRVLNRHKLAQVLFHSWISLHSGLQEIEYTAHPNVFEFFDKDVLL